MDRLTELRKQAKSRCLWATSSGGNLRRWISSMIGTVMFVRSPSSIITALFTIDSSFSRRCCNSDSPVLSVTQFTSGNRGSSSNIISKPSKRGREQAFLSQTQKKTLKLAHYPNYCTESNQILHSDKDHQILFVGDPNTRITNPRWRMAAVLKNQ